MCEGSGFLLGVGIWEGIGSGLALQHVTPIYEKHIAWRFLNGISHKSMHSLKASFAPMVMPEVVRKVVSMYVGGKYYFKVYCVFAHLSLVLVLLLSSPQDVIKVERMGKSKIDLIIFLFLIKASKIILYIICDAFYTFI